VVANGKQVIANVGGDLNIESLQDTSKYHTKDQSLGGSVTVGMGFLGSANYSQQKIDSDFASVTQQSDVDLKDRTVININAVRELIVSLASTHGVRRQDMVDSWNEQKESLDWRMDYQGDLETSLQRDFERLSCYVRLCEIARQNEDSLAMRAALMEMRVSAMNIASCFDAMADDLERLLIMERDAPGSLPFPENYKFPEHYPK